MDLDTFEKIILPILTLLAGSGGTYLVFRNQAKAAETSAERLVRDENRQDFVALNDQQADTIQRLDERVKRLETELDHERERRVALEQQMARLLTMYKLIRRAILHECERKRDCPIWKYLDENERGQVVDELGVE